MGKVLICFGDLYQADTPEIIFVISLRLFSKRLEN